MSHFTKCELKLKNLAALKRALEDLELGFEEAEQGQAATVRGYRGQTMEAVMSINMGKYDVGVVQNQAGEYEMVADWWGVETTRGVTEEEFQDKLKRRYAYHNVLMACEDKGYTVEEEENLEDGTVNLVVRRWVND
ncbi:MAG: DUF1257 domain-containing protein [Deltaproteobacteria bacterium]|nr:DUF1257 domain-containing protein [Deltaproteobacteria bacterium]